MSQPSPFIPSLSIEDYLALEETSAIRHELIDGSLYAMAGGTLIHNLIVQGLRDVLVRQLRPRGCRVFTENVKLNFADDFFYPDVMVSCNRHTEGRLYVTEPVLLAEILSEGNIAHDRVTKFNIYRRIPSLQAYLVLSQEDLRIEVWGTDNQWDRARVYDAGEVIQLTALTLDLPVDEIYTEVRVDLGR